MGGTFQAALRPVDVLTLDDIAERWASYSGQPQGMAKSHLMGFESFILDQLAKGYRLDFGLVSFYPRLSGGLTSRDADPESDGLFVRGAVKARRALVNGLKRRLVAENAQETSRVRIYSVFDRETGRGGIVTPVLGFVQSSSAGATGIVCVLLACLAYLFVLGLFAGRSSTKEHVAQK